MLSTEKRNPKTMHIDKMNTYDMLKIINEENLNAVRAVEAELESIEKAVDAASNALKNGGRIIYIYISAAAHRDASVYLMHQNAHQLSVFLPIKLSE